MDRILTIEQKNISIALDELTKTPWRKYIKEYIDWSIKTREDILLWKIELPKEDELDKIQYSRNKVLREELKLLHSIADYPTNIVKTFWVYQAE